MIDANKLPLALLLVQKDKKIIYATNLLHLLFKYDDGELIGKDLDIIVPEEYRYKHNKMFDLYLVNPQPLDIDRDLQGLAKDGSIIPIEIKLYPYNDGVLALISDLSVKHIMQVKNAIMALKEKLENIENTLLNA